MTLRDPAGDGDAYGGAARDGRGDALAVGSVLAWAAGAAVAGRHGVWLGLGGVAVACAIVLLALDGAHLVPRMRPTGPQLLLGLAVGGAMAAATHVFYPIAVRTLPAIAGETTRLYVAFTALSPALSALALVPVVVGEELVWRGVVYAALRRRVGPVAAVIAGAILYACAHAPVGSALLVLTALACGLVWGWLRARTGGLAASLACHVVWDAIVLLAFPLAPH